MRPPDLIALFAEVQRFAGAAYPNYVGAEVLFRLPDGRTTSLAVPACPCAPAAETPPAERFVPNTFQEAILEALDGKALRTDALAAKVGDRARLFREKGGLKELKAAGLVGRHDRLGFYRTDSPPEELEGDVV